MTLVKIGVSTNRMTNYTPMAYSPTTRNGPIAGLRHNGNASPAAVNKCCGRLVQRVLAACYLCSRLHTITLMRLRQAAAPILPRNCRCGSRAQSLVAMVNSASGTIRTATLRRPPTT